MLYLFYEKNNNTLQWVLPGGALFDAQTLFIFYGNICVLFSNISRKITVLLKMYSSCIYNAFTVLFKKYCLLTNNLLIPDMSCITYCLSLASPNVSINFAVHFYRSWFHVMSYYTCLIIFYFAWLLYLCKKYLSYLFC